MNRRQFFAGSAVAGTGGAYWQARAAASDRLGVGVIGCGGMGSVNLVDFQKQPDVDIVAVCDVYQTNLHKAQAATQGKAKTYDDYRKLLADRNVQAVVVATPDHWHAMVCVDACRAGKDVYVEKPVSHCIREGRLMVEAARQSNRIVQVGLQQRSGIHFQRAVKIVQEGRLGRIHYVQCWNHEKHAAEGMGNPPDSAPPAGLDWNFWLGPAPKTSFNRNRFGGTFRWFYDYGGGKLADWGSHLVDIARWAMKVDGPLSASASGGKYYYTDNRDTPDTLDVNFEFHGFLLRYSTLQHNSYGHNGDPGARPYGSYGILFQGTEGSLFVDRAGYRMDAQCTSRIEGGIGIRDVDDLTGTNVFYTAGIREESASTSLQHLPHVRNFLDCVKTRKRPLADIEEGHLSTALCHLGNIAFRVGQKIAWDAKTEQVTNNQEANRLVTCRYRAPWHLEGL